MSRYVQNFETVLATLDRTILIGMVAEEFVSLAPTPPARAFLRQFSTKAIWPLAPDPGS
jgi:hypothetical protein